MIGDLNFSVQHFAEIPSTSKVLLDQRDAPEFHGRVVWATNMTAGKGRFNRVWQMRPGNLATSIGLRFTTADSAKIPLVTTWASVAIYEALARYLSSTEKLSIKWPNDLTYDGKKMVGVLCQARQQGDSIAIALGIGVNLAWAPADPEMDAIALRDAPECQTVPSPEDFLHALIGEMEKIKQLDLEAVRAEWIRRCKFLGRQVWHGNIDEPAEMQQALAVDIDLEGNLIIEKEGRRETITNQDLRLNRPLSS